MNDLNTPFERKILKMGKKARHNYVIYKNSL